MLMLPPMCALIGPIAHIVLLMAPNVNPVLTWSWNDICNHVNGSNAISSGHFTCMHTIIGMCFLFCSIL